MSDNQRDLLTVFVRKIPLDASKEELEQLFSNYGPIRSCFIVGQSSPEQEDPSNTSNNANTDNSSVGRGFGFVKFVQKEDAAKRSVQIWWIYKLWPVDQAMDGLYVSWS